MSDANMAAAARLRKAAADNVLALIEEASLLRENDHLPDRSP